MGLWSNTITVLVVALAFAGTLPFPSEDRFRSYLKRESKSDKSSLSLQSMKESYWPVNFKSVGPLSYAYFDKHHYIGLGVSWARFPKNLNLRKKWKKLKQEDVETWFFFINLIVYVGWVSVNGKFMRRHFLCSLENLKSGRIYTMLLSNISHAHISHFMGNMLAFQSMIPFMFQSRALRKSAVDLMIGSALCGSLLSIFYFNVILRIRHELLGASALDCGLQTFIALHKPETAFNVWGIKMTARQLLVFSFFLEFARGGGGVGGTGVDFACHIGGVLFAWYYYYNIF